MKKRAACLIAGFLFSLAANASAVLLDFEDVTIINPLRTDFSTSSGFNFTNYAPVRTDGVNFSASTETSIHAISGLNYTFDLNRSGDNVLYTRNAYGFLMTHGGGLFSLTDAYIMSATSSNQHIIVDGYVGGTGGTKLYTTDITLDNVVANSHRTFNWSDIDTVVFSPQTALDGNAGFVVVDDIGATVPEPSSLILLGVGLVGAYFIKRKKA